MSDTPRTNAEAQTCMDTSSEWHGEWVRLDFARQLERELDAANERVMRMEEAGGLALGYASKGDFESADEVWSKAKETQP